MTISNHVNFEKLLLRIFDTKYKSIEVGGGVGGFAQAISMEWRKQERIWANMLYLKERDPTTGVKKAATESYII